MQEDFDRRKRVKNWTNFIALAALFDVFISVPLLILTLRAQELTEISTLIGCMQISCHEFLILISSWILLRCGRNHFDRIDATGAWMIVHFVTIIGNVSLLTFEAWPEYGDLENTSLFVRVLLGWKLFFVFVELLGIIYSYYIVHNPITYLKPRSSNITHREELPSSSNSTSTAANTQQQQQQQQERRSTNDINIGSRSHERENQGFSNEMIQRAVQKGRANQRSYQGSSSGSAMPAPPPYTLNPAFDSELSLDYARNYSPYDQMVNRNRNRLSNVDPRYGATTSNRM